MVDLLYVRHVRRKKIAAIISLVTAGTLTAMGIIAFLGRTVGAFSITLQKSDVEISLSETSDFANPTTYLRVDNLPSSTLWTNGWIQSAADDSVIDNQDTNYVQYGAKKDAEGNITALNYFKYTFYIKNVGLVNARYTFTLNILDITNPKNPVSSDLGDILRVRVYENNGYDDSLHESRVFAKTSREVNVDEEGNPTNREYVAGPQYTTGYDGLAEEFESIGRNSGVVMKSEVTNFRTDDMIRYTIVYWLEGEDPEASGVAPEDCSIKLGVNIKAYEN